MTDRDSRDLVKDFRTPVVPVEPPEVVLARRMSTVGRLRELQRRELVLGVRRRSRKKWLLLAAIVALPAAVFAATRVVGRSDGAAHENAANAAPTRTAVAEPKASHPVGAPLALEALPLVTPEEGRMAPSSVPVSSTGHARGPSALPNRSTLAAENALMQSALVAARRGEEARASALLTEFLTRYPSSPLAQNAEVERFRAQYRSGNVSRAKELAATYVGKHPGGMAEDEARRLAQDDRPSSASLP